MNYAIIFAGGVGSRMGSSVPKQFLEVAEKPIIIHTLEKFAQHPEIDGIVVVCKEEFIDYCCECIARFRTGKVMNVVAGGENGQQSIYNGLQYLKAHITYERNNVVLIHDGVRPVITEELITKSIRCTEQYGNSIAVSRAIETVIKVDDEGQIVETVDRDRCRNAKAPQCFILDEILEAHNRAIVEKRLNMIDSASLMSYYGYELHTVECSSENIKITTPNDYYMLLGMYQERGQL